MDDIQMAKEIITMKNAHGLTEDSHDENVGEVKAEEVRGSVALEAARRANPPNPWSPRLLKLYCCCIVAFLCSTLNGTSASSAEPYLKTPFGDPLLFRL